MRKRIAFIMATVCVLLITGCGESNSAEDSVGADSQMAGNAEQTGTERVNTENTIDTAFDEERQEIIYTKIEYSTNNVIKTIEVDVQNGTIAR